MFFFFFLNIHFDVLYLRNQGKSLESFQVGGGRPVNLYGRTGVVGLLRMEHSAVSADYFPTDMLCPCPCVKSPNGVLMAKPVPRPTPKSPLAWPTPTPVAVPLGDTLPIPKPAAWPPPNPGPANPGRGA